LTNPVGPMSSPTGPVRPDTHRGHHLDRRLGERPPPHNARLAAGLCPRTRPLSACAGWHEGLSEYVPAGIELVGQSRPEGGNGHISRPHRGIGEDRPPGFHRTDTIDIILMVSGEITCELDRCAVTLRPGDTLVQNGGPHAWTNRGPAQPFLPASWLTPGPRAEVPAPTSCPEG